MSRFANVIIIFLVTVFLTACGGGGGSGGTTTPDPVTLNGIAVDGYLSGATVCIDTNKNNTCDSNEKNTTTNTNGEFTFTDVVPTEDMIIIAYGGKDADTNESFPYIIKNLATNTDQNGTVVLSSLNTLVVDYKIATNSDVDVAKTKIAQFIDTNDTTSLVADLVANKTSHPELLTKSLQIFQMIEKIKSSSIKSTDNEKSGESFQALATAIKNATTTPIKYNDTNITVIVNNQSINAAVVNMKPVFTSSAAVSVNENQISALTLQAHDDNATLTYSISDNTNFDVNSSTGVVTFKSNMLPNYETKKSYTFTATVSDGTNEVNQTVTINILNVNEAPVLGTDLSFSINEDNNYTGTLPIATDVDSQNLSYLLESGASHGSLSLNTNGSFTYTPTANYNGIDSFSYKVSDGSLGAVQTVRITVNSINDVPVITSSATATVNENQLGAITLSATDIDVGDSLTYSISGTDAGDFNISNSTVTFKVAPDYESGKISYSFTARVSDGNVTVEQNVTININNLNDNQPVFISGTTVTVNENQSNAIDINATDADGNNTLIYGIKNGLDKNSFQIVPSTGVVTFITPPDYESTKKSYTFTATVSDGVTTKEQTITINIRNINETSPIFTSENNVSVFENQTGAIALVATDADGDALSYDINDTTNFSVNSSGVVTFNNAPDYETKTSYTFIATASDGTNEVNQTVTINIQNVPETAPTITALTTSIDENVPVGTIVGTVPVSNSGDTSITNFTLSDSTNFEINATGTIKTKPVTFDYESATKNYNLTVYATNSKGNSTPVSVTITLNNLNDNAPIITSTSIPSVDENQSVAMTVVATDVDNLMSLTYSISDENSSLFDINSSTGVITFTNLLDNDYEKAHFYSFKVSVSDGTFTTEQNITLSINSINLSAPRFTSTNNISVNENQQTVLTLVATDAESGTVLEYGISDTINFDINSSTGVVTFKSDKLPDYEDTNRPLHKYEFTASATDGTYTTSQNIIVNINNLNDNRPIFTQDNNVTVDENQINVLSNLHVTDADGNLTTLTYSISEDNATLFDINRSTGVITFKDINSSDYEKAHFYKFKVSVSDTFYTTEQNITVTINNLDDNSPSFTSDASATANENQNNAIDINATDVDESTLTYSIKNGVGDYSAFDINETTGAVIFKVAPNYESGKTLYTFTATVSDTIHSVDQNITININNLNDNQPVFTSNATQYVDENNGSAYITLSATDADNLTPVIYSISGGDAIYFTANSATGKVLLNFTPDYETKSSYTFTAKATDGEHNTTQLVTVNINNLVEITNDSPTDLTLSQNTINENNTIGNTVGTLNSVDADTPSGPFTYSLVGGTGSTDNSSFSISGDLLKMAISANFETKSTYNIRIQTKDDGNATFEKEFTIYINNVNEKPTITTSNYGSYYEDDSFITEALSVSDPDSGDTHTFTFKSSTPAESWLDSNSSTFISSGVLTGHIGDTSVGTNIFTVRVTDAGGLYSDKNITLTINEVDDKPSSNYNVEQNLTASPTTPATLSIGQIEDGDSHLSQTVTLSIVDNNNSDSILAEVIDSDGTESGVNTTDGTASLRFTYKKAGQSTITFKLSDGGMEQIYKVYVTARGSGHDLYEEQKDSNYTIPTVTFDGINYTWDSANRWYATTDANVSLQKILMPMKLLSAGADTYNKGQNVVKYGDGHYYVLKSSYLNDTRKTATTSTYSRADSGTISVKDRYFQHDKTHHAFVSTVIYTDTNLPLSKKYNSSSIGAKDGWIFDTVSTYVTATDKNETYGTDINISLGYATSTELKGQLIDTHNNGDDFCGDYFGIGWRLPTAYEMGINTALSSTVGFLPAYIGNYTTTAIGIIGSTKVVNSTTNHWMLQDDTGKSFNNLSKDNRYARCMYVP